MIHRPRRLRNSPGIRNLVRETNLMINDLVYPLFVMAGENIKEEITSLPGCYHYSVDRVLEEVDEVVNLGIKVILLFGLPAEKDDRGSSAWAANSVVQRAVKKIKKAYPDLVVITDICLCGYTSHGHCGLINDGKIENDTTLEVLSEIALSHARAGVDMVAPSDMMDGRVRAIRSKLDREGFYQLPIMSYSVKYASSFYGPFREAANSAPGFGDRSTYQMDWANSKEALKEVELDIEEGADIIMVKTALSYLDIIYQVKEKTNLPIAAYSVSGEYSMVKNAAAAGICDYNKMMMEMLNSIKRAGADIVITYFAKEVARLLNDRGGF